MCENPQISGRSPWIYQLVSIGTFEGPTESCLELERLVTWLWNPTKPSGDSKGLFDFSNMTTDVNWHIWGFNVSPPIKWSRGGLEGEYSLFSYPSQFHKGKWNSSASLHQSRIHHQGMCLLRCVCMERSHQLDYTNPLFPAQIHFLGNIYLYAWVPLSSNTVGNYMDSNTWW